jgi:hypothetical protein
MSDDKKDFLALALAKLGQDTIVSYTTEATAITIASVQSEAEDQPYGVFRRDGGKWFCIGIAYGGKFIPKEVPEEVKPDVH